MTALAVTSLSQWGIADVAIVVGVILIALDRLLDVTGKLPSSRRLRMENDHLTGVNAAYLEEIDQLKKRLAELQEEVWLLKKTDMSSMLSFLKQHDADTKAFVANVVDALGEVRDGLHELVLEIRESRPTPA